MQMLTTEEHLNKLWYGHMVKYNEIFKNHWYDKISKIYQRILKVQNNTLCLKPLLYFKICILQYTKNISGRIHKQALIVPSMEWNCGWAMERDFFFNLYLLEKFYFTRYTYYILK